MSKWLCEVCNNEVYDFIENHPHLAKRRFCQKCKRQTYHAPRAVTNALKPARASTISRSVSRSDERGKKVVRPVKII